MKREYVKGELVIVGVPIGNYDDLSPRACTCLKEAQLILCEDTRESGKLLLNFGIQTKMMSYVGSYNSAVSAAKRAIESGGQVALISDRGMPCISDPGAQIINHIRAQGLKVTSIPGPSAATTAFALTGYCGPFIFHGFLPRKTGDILKIARKLHELEYHIVFFESPHRMEDTLNTLSQIFTGREITIARELTKTYEQVIQCKIDEAQKYKDYFKGECVLIIKGC